MGIGRRTQSRDKHGEDIFHVGADRRSLADRGPPQHGRARCTAIARSCAIGILAGSGADRHGSADSDRIIIIGDPRSASTAAACSGHQPHRQGRPRDRRGPRPGPVKPTSPVAALVEQPRSSARSSCLAAAAVPVTSNAWRSGRRRRLRDPAAGSRAPTLGHTSESPRPWPADPVAVVPGVDPRARTGFPVRVAEDSERARIQPQVHSVSTPAPSAAPRRRRAQPAVGRRDVIFDRVAGPFGRSEAPARWGLPRTVSNRATPPCPGR